MAPYGRGHCHAGANYYAGWDDHIFTINYDDYSGKDSYEQCKALCLSEPQCTFASSIPGVTCSRYSGKTCKFTDTHKGRFFEHVTFKKEITGKFKL